MKTFSIYKVTSDPVVDFAADELKRYLFMMMPDCHSISISYDPKATDGFRLGVANDLGLDNLSVEDALLDDCLFASCDEKGGIISGANPRSVLLSVYEYFRHNGCRWLFPGVDGEFIPCRDVGPVSFLIRPSCRFRGVANCSAASYDHIAAFIDFLPKVGMNTFMVEFKTPVHFTNFYYSHSRNTENHPAEHVTESQVLAWKRSSECLAARRGLVFHDVGHGFNAEPFGIDPSALWDIQDDASIPDETRKYLAQLNGHRGLFGGKALNTQFCMSNPEARTRMAKCVADYAEGRGNVDVLHVWLADGCNNHCECEECQKHSPSDFYVMIMNEIDREMTARKLKTRVVFISYMDISWAPMHEKLEHPDRFILMTAPFTRINYDSIPKGEELLRQQPYVRNKNKWATKLEEYISHAKDWKKNFSGPAMAYEYHFCWPMYHDLSLLGNAKLIHDEICLYKKHGIDGMVECGTVRHSFPNGILFYMVSRTLFSNETSANDIIEDYFKCAYGENYREFIDFFQRVGDVFPWKYFAKIDSADPSISVYYNPERTKHFAGIDDLVKEGRALVEKYYTSDVRVQTVSVRMLEAYLPFLQGVAEVFSALSVNDKERAAECYRRFRPEWGKRESTIGAHFNHLSFFSYLHYAVFKNTNEIDFQQ